MLKPSLFLCAIAIFALSTTAPAIADEPILLTDLEENPVNPLDAGDKKAVVLFFISPYCPTSNTFAPYMTEITEAFGDDFAFFSIHSDTSVSDTDRATHAKMMEITHPVLKDGEQLLAKKLGATITPEVFVIDAQGEILYAGRINDLYLGATQKQKEPTTHDLRDALKAITAGEPIAVPKTEAVGCTISGV